MIVSRQLQFRKIFQTMFTKKGNNILPDEKYLVGTDHFGNQECFVSENPKLVLFSPFLILWK